MPVTVRAFALITIGLLVVYYVMRVLATQCAGAACDGYIAPSLLLPLLILISAAVTGVMAVTAARRAPSGGAWPAILGVCAALGALGPLVSLAIFRDSPDTFVPLATALVALIPISALLHSFFAGRPRT